MFNCQFQILFRNMSYSDANCSILRLSNKNNRSASKYAIYKYYYYYSPDNSFKTLVPNLKKNGLITGKLYISVIRKICSSKLTINIQGLSSNKKVDVRFRS